MAENNPSFSSSEIELLVATLQATDGTINFQVVADKMSLSSTGAAGKRIKRLFEKIAPGENVLVGSTLGSGRSGATPKGGRKSSTDDVKVPATPKVPVTPRSGSKRKAKDVEETEATEEDEEAAADEPEDSPTKNGTTNGASESPGSGSKKAKTTKKASPKAKKSPRAGTKAKATKTPTKGKGGKANAVVIDDTEDAEDPSNGTADDVDPTTPVDRVKTEDEVKPKAEDTTTAVDAVKIEEDLDTTQSDKAAEVDGSGHDNEEKNE